MAAASVENLVMVDPAALHEALDGRTGRWLARRAGISDSTVARLRRGHRTQRAVYDRLRAALPALPPAPEATNGHAPTEGASEEGAGA